MTSVHLSGGEIPAPKPARPAANGDGLEFLVRLVDLDPLDQRLTLQSRMGLWRDGTQVAEEEHTLHTILYFRNELLLILEQAGFVEVPVYGYVTERAAKPMTLGRSPLPAISVCRLLLLNASIVGPPQNMNDEGSSSGRQVGTDKRRSPTQRRLSRGAAIPRSVSQESAESAWRAVSRPKHRTQACPSPYDTTKGKNTCDCSLDAVTVMVPVISGWIAQT